MKLRSVALIVRFLLTFIRRRVLGRGVLRPRVAKVVAAIIALAAFVGYCALTTFVLQQYFEPGTNEILLLSAGVAAPLWVLIAYTVIRVLFLKADELVALTFTLPATNRERALAFSAFETLIVMAAAMVVFGAFIIAATIISGVGFFVDAIVAIVLPALLSYLLFSVLYLAFERAVIALGLARLRGLLMPVAFTAALIATFIAVNAQSQEMLSAYVEEVPFHAPQLVFLTLANEVHPLVAFATFAIALGLGVVLVLWAAPRDYEPMKRNYRILPRRFAASSVGVHLLALVRSFETLIVVVFSVLALVAMVYFNIAMPPFVLLLVTFQGVYAFSNTDSIRRTTPRIRTVVDSYISMIAAQTIIVAVVGIPAVAASTLLGIGLQHSMLVVGFCISNIVLTTLVGIMFPADKGNPFSVVIGVVLVFAVVAMLAVGINLFSLPLVANAAITILLVSLAAVLSVTGMNRIERNRRYVLAA